MTTNEYRSFYYDELQKEPVTDDFTLPAGTEMTPVLLRELIDEHEESRVPRYMRLKAAYEGKYLIFGRGPKPDYKPDNRLAADMAKYLCDTFNGFFIGKPVTVRHESKDVASWLEKHENKVGQDDINAELAEECSKYGRCYEYLYQGEDGDPYSVCLTPISTFMVYDDTVAHRPMYGVRYSYNEDGELKGSWCDGQNTVPFEDEGGSIVFGDEDPHSFGGVPMVEYVENKEKRGVYEGVLNLIEAYSKALSEKANDVDYFADAYLVIEGAELREGYKKDLREYRLINLWNNNQSQIKAYFLAKPDADSTQENLINRLETLIYKLSMVPDISDESFGTASGIALKMRLLPMSNLAKKKERKFIASMRRRYRLLENYPTTPLSDGDWASLELVMHRNMPDDLASEAGLAGSLSGIVSEETQLSVLSCVDDPRKEIERKEAEKDMKAAGMSDGWPTNRTAQMEPIEPEGGIQTEDDRNLQR